MHILVIDDDDRLRQLLKQFLKKNNFNVSVSSNAIKAKKILNEFYFDLIVLDVMMPGKSGIEFLNLILQYNVYKVQQNVKGTYIRCYVGLSEYFYFIYAVIAIRDMIFHVIGVS